MCRKCHTGFFLINDQCTVLPNNCIEVNGEGTCTKCDNKYSLNDSDVCVFEEDNCYEYNEGECSRCDDGYFLFNGICYLNINNTSLKTFNLEFNGEASIFVRSELKCQAGHYQKRTLFDNSCLRVINKPRCQTYNFTAFAELPEEQLQCTACKTGYLSNNTCSPYTIVENCQEYNPTANLC